MVTMVRTSNSSAVKAMGYDTETETLFVEFKKIKKYPTYQFSPVPAHTAGRMFKASSIGGYYHAYIKPRKQYYVSEPSTLDLTGTINAARNSTTTILLKAIKTYINRSEILSNGRSNKVKNRTIPER